MVYMSTGATHITGMPRGGFDASWLDRRLQTERSEYLDRDDERLKRRVVRSLEVAGGLFRLHQRFARIVLDEVATVPDPRILELGAGHGGLSRELLRAHPTAQVTVSDVEPGLVAAIAAGDLGANPRAVVRRIDATAIDAPDRSFDVAVFTLSFHHLPPLAAAQVFAEGTRVADKLLIIDLARPPAPLHVLRVAALLPFAPLVPAAHDGVISSLRAYSPSALLTLARHADPAIEVELRSGGFAAPFRGRPQIVVASRR